MHFDEQKMLDKIAGIWYNRSTLRGGLWRARRMNNNTFIMNKNLIYKKMGRAFCSRPVASILPTWGFQKLPACCLHIYIPHSRTSACGSLALASLTTLTGDLLLAPLGCPRFSHRGGGLFRIPRAPWISDWEQPAGCIDASHSAVRWEHTL